MRKAHWEVKTRNYPKLPEVDREYPKTDQEFP